jgi:hypothetical protein
MIVSLEVRFWRAIVTFQTQFIPRTHLLFLQLNLLEDVYQNRTLLPYKKLTIHESWAKNILAPWINNDSNHIKVLTHIFQTNDIMNPDFVRWLKMLIPLKPIQ